MTSTDWQHATRVRRRLTKQALVALSLLVVTPSIAQTKSADAAEYCEDVAVLMEAIDQESVRCDPSESPSYKFAVTYQSNDANFYQIAARYRKLCAAGIRGPRLREQARNLCLDALKREGQNRP